jgi:hypothetical protein
MATKPTAARYASPTRPRRQGDVAALKLQGTSSQAPNLPEAKEHRSWEAGRDVISMLPCAASIGWSARRVGRGVATDRPQPLLVDNIADEVSREFFSRCRGIIGHQAHHPERSAAKVRKLPVLRSRLPVQTMTNFRSGTPDHYGQVDPIVKPLGRGSRLPTSDDLEPGHLDPTRPAP